MPAMRKNKTKSAPVTQAAKEHASEKSARAKQSAYPQFTDFNHFKTMEDIMTNGKAPFDKMSQDATKMYQESQEALAESGRVYAKHVESITQFMTNLTQESVEKNTEAFKSLYGCKTLHDFTEAQSKLVQQNFDDFMASATKLSELSIKLATEACEPLNDQFSKTIQKSMAA